MTQDDFDSEASDVAAPKAELRTHFRRLRDALCKGQHALASRAICERITDWITTNLPPQATIASYFPFGSEIDLHPLHHKLLPNHQLLFPRIANRDLEWVDISQQAFLESQARKEVLDRLGLTENDLEQPQKQETHFWQEHRWGFLEPIGPALDLEQTPIDLVIVPALAVDKEHYRLGYGGGFYDRALSKMAQLLPQKPVTLTPIFASHSLESMPRFASDIPVDVVISEVD